MCERGRSEWRASPEEQASSSGDKGDLFSFEDAPKKSKVSGGNWLLVFCWLGCIW